MNLIVIFSAFTLVPPIHAFLWRPSSAQETHTSITVKGCIMAAESYLKYFPTYDPKCIIKSNGFTVAVGTLATGNARMDIDDIAYWRAWYHSDSELFLDAADQIRAKRVEATNLAKKGDYRRARVAIGNAFHTCQDFYSHSNWVELGNREPSPGTMGNKDFGVPIAKPDEIVCKPCENETGYCYNNLVTTKLTSAFYHKEMDKNGKNLPKDGKKCSHGGGADEGVSEAPKGGIDKDYPDDTSPHGYLHYIAAEVAAKATRDLLLKGVLADMGKVTFENFLGLFQPSCKLGAVARGQPAAKNTSESS